MMFGVPSVSVGDLDREPPDTVLLDVREDEEWVAGHAIDAIHVPLSELPAGLADSGPSTGPAASSWSAASAPGQRRLPPG